MKTPEQVERAYIEAVFIIKNLLFAPNEIAYRNAAQRWLRENVPPPPKRPTE